MSWNSSNCDSLVRHLCKFVGETVTIFTTSGGASGCGFTGVILSVNHKFVRLLTRMGEPPANPLAKNICGDIDGGCMSGYKGFGMSDGDSLLGKSHMKDSGSRVGSICDIPIDRIAAFCHNTV